MSSMTQSKQYNGVKETLFAIPDLQETMVNQKPIGASVTGSSHRTWVYVFAGAFIGLLAITAVTLWLSFQTNPVKVRDTSRISLPAEPAQVALLTGGDKTPATQSKLNTENSMSKDWLVKNFAIRTGVLDENGKCLKATVCSETADPDQDGLINLYEYNYGTDPNDPDTDKDGLTDTIELFVYYSNPKLKDSDSDLLTDFEELKACGDPIKSDELLSESRKAQFISDMALFPARQPTLGMFKKAGATDQDIKNGYLKIGCEPTASVNEPSLGQ
jgi:hypothetical protein